MALDAAVGSAYAARGRYLLSQGLTGPMYADGGVVRCDAGPSSEVSQASIIQINGLDRIAVLRLHVLQQRCPTLADLTLKQLIGFPAVLHMGDESFGNALRRPTLAVIIDDGVARAFCAAHRC
ncbi:MAG: hypothetical protein JWN34_2088 [Bryobacterales bacterium]|nr:hypothetical protein [Bryobacterales bacterium]